MSIADAHRLRSSLNRLKDTNVMSQLPIFIADNPEKWLENTRTELYRRMNTLEQAQRDVDSRLERLEQCVGQSLASVNSCIDDLMLNLLSKDKGKQPNKSSNAPENIKIDYEKDVPKKPVLSAAQSGDLAAVKVLLLDGALDDCIDGTSVLEMAAAYGHTEIVKLLLQHNTEEKLSSAVFNKQLDLALSVAGVPQIVQLLIGKVGKESKAAAMRSAAQEGRTAVLREILSFGVNVNEMDENGYTALHFAVDQGQIECAEVLLEFGAKCSYVAGPLLKTPLHLAAKEGHSSCIDLLLRKGSHGINARDRQSWTPLHYAVQRLDPESVRMLLEHGADISLVDNQGKSALHLAALVSALEKNDNPDASTVLSCRKKILKMLLDAGADPSAKTENGLTPLDQDGAEALRSVME